MRRAFNTRLAVALVMFIAAPAAAHPAPFSYLDLHLDASGVSGTLVVHDLDAAHDLGIANADTLLEPAVASRIVTRSSRCSARESTWYSRTARRHHLGGDRCRSRPAERSARVHREFERGRSHWGTRLRVPVQSDSPDFHQHL